MGSRSVIIDLVDNRKYCCECGTIYAEFDDSRKQSLIGSKRPKVSWERPEDWERIATRIKNARNDRVQSNVYILGEDGYEDGAEGLFCVSRRANGFDIQTGNLVGSIVKKNGDNPADKAIGRISIGSRFGDEFLRYIISDADGFCSIKDAGGSEQNPNGYDWLLGYLWNTKFKAAYRLGLPKCYTTKSEKLVSPRGQLDTMGYYEYPQRGKIGCTYRELSYSNSAAALFVQAWKVLNKRESTKVFCRPTANISQTFQQALGDERFRRSELLKTKHFTNAFYGEYNDLIDLSKFVLRSWGSDFSSEAKADAILFDVSMLFEYYIRKLLNRNGFRMLPKKEERPLDVPTLPLEGEYRRDMIPDLVFQVDDGMCVFDAKYKNYEPKYGVKREDVFQLHTYIGQYGNDAPIKACGFIYPIGESKWRKYRNDKTDAVVLNTKMAQQGREILFCVGFLVVPDQDEDGKVAQEEFWEKMSQNAQNLANKLRETIRAGSAQA